LSRGRVIPVINLRARFGFEKIPHDSRTRLVVLNFDNRTIGVVVDTAREFVPVPTDALQPPPEKARRKAEAKAHQAEGLSQFLSFPRAGVGTHFRSKSGPQARKKGTLLLPKSVLTKARGNQKRDAFATQIGSNKGAWEPEKKFRTPMIKRKIV
jgi:hypothetical protein